MNKHTILVLSDFRLLEFLSCQVFALTPAA